MFAFGQTPPLLPAYVLCWLIYPSEKVCLVITEMDF